MAPGVVSHLPPGIDDRPLPNFDDTIARLKSRAGGCQDQINVRPLVLMVVDVIRNLTEQKAVRP